MRDEDVKLNMMVIIKSKYSGKLENSVVYNILKERNQSYAYVARIINYYSNTMTYVLSEDINGHGDFFICTDFDPCIKEERKNKLKKIYKCNEYK